MESRIVVNSFVHVHDSSFLFINPDDSSMKAHGNGVPVVSLLSYPRIYHCSHRIATVRETCQASISAQFTVCGRFRHECLHCIVRIAEATREFAARNVTGCLSLS